MKRINWHTLVAMIYPPTKAKLHRALHAGLTAVTVAASIVVWLHGQKWGWSFWNQVEAQTVLIGAFLARAKAAFAKLDSVVDELPIPDTDEPPTTVERKRDAGVNAFVGMLMMMLLGMAAILVMLLLFIRCAHADQQFGGCSISGVVCAGPAVAVTLGELNLSTSKFSGGISPGVGYGVTLCQDRWYATGAAFYAAFSVGGGKPNSLDPSLMVSFANYLRIGFALPISEKDGGGLNHEFVLRFGIGADFGKAVQ